MLLCCLSCSGTDCKRKALKIHREKCLDCTAGRFLKCVIGSNDGKIEWAGVRVKVRRSKVEDPQPPNTKNGSPCDIDKNLTNNST